MNNQYRDRIIKGLQENTEEWPELLTRPRMEKERFVKLLGNAAMHAVPHRKIRLAWGR